MTTIDQLKNGLDRYIAEYGRMPTAGEIDRCDWLPSARLIQRRFGGLKELRARLGYEDIDLSQGEFRRKQAKNISKSGREAEREVYSLLVDHFGEVFVHDQKGYGDGLKRLDDYVYSPDGNFGVDVFVASSEVSLRNNLRQKMANYDGFNELLYLVYVYPGDLGLPSGVNRIPMQLDEFRKAIKDYSAYPNPLRRIYA
jgi:hypothetical protein